MKQNKKIRLKNTSIAACGGAVLSLILIYAYDTERTFLSFSSLILSLTAFWVVNVLVVVMVASGYTERFKDGSITAPQMYWAGTTTVICMGVTEGFSEVYYLLTFLIMTFGLFRLTLRQFNYFCAFLIFAVGAQTVIKHTNAYLGYAPSDAYIEWGIFTFCAVGLTSLCKSMARIRQRLREKNEELSAALETKSMFLANMSHELRTPLNGVVGMLSLLRDGDLSKHESHQLEIALSSAKSLSVIVNDILDFSQLEAGEFNLEKSRFNLCECITTIAESTALLAQEKGIELIIDLSGISESSVVGDEARIQKILQNLASNALKFTEKGEILIRASLKRSEGKLRLNCLVRDSGIGIESEKMGSIFKSFAQVDGTTTRKYGGTGLGLAIVKDLCQLMDGDVRVTLNADGGCDFSFHISLDIDEQAASFDIPTFAKDAQVLIIDKSQASCEAITAQMHAWGAHVVSAQTINEAKDILEDNNSAHGLGYILIDECAYQSDNGAFVDYIRTRLPFQRCEIHLMLASGFQSVNSGANFYDFDSCFSKPVSHEKLLKIFSEQQNTGFANKTKKNRAGEKLTSSAAHILLVEDNDINQEVAIGILEDMSISCDTASNGQEAIDMLLDRDGNDAYPLILMDCQMPVLDGYKTTEKIRQGMAGQNNKDIVIIAMTANAMAGDREKCLDAGMNAYLSKPINDDALCAMLNKYLAVEIKID